MQEEEMFGDGGYDYDYSYDAGGYGDTEFGDYY
jgi:hypothetical protein